MKKYALIITVVLIAGISILGYIKIKASETGSFTSRADGTDGARGRAIASHVSELTKQSSLMREAIKQMIAAGSSPEKITFTGAQSPDDVFGSGKVDLKTLVPLRGTCISSSCEWKFLPAVKKDKGWYVYGVGTSATDIIAYLPGFNEGLCMWMEAFGPNRPHVLNPNMPDGAQDRPKQTTTSFDPEKPDVYMPEGGATTIKTEYGILDGQLEGCFNNRVGDGPDNFIYYNVLLAQ